MKRLAAIIFLFLCTAGGAAAQTIVMTLSTDRVAITSNFTGVGVTVFGAIEGDPSTGTPVDLVVTLRGPAETVTVRRKESVLGLWINRAEATLAGVPAFYALHATAPLADVASAPALSALRLGISAITRALGVPRNFAEALIRLRAAAGIYYERTDAIDRRSATVFRTTFDLPADIAIGIYTAEVLLFRDSALLATGSQQLEIIKTGAEQFIYDASRNEPWLYAFAVVAMAIAAGWLGGVVFRRD